MTYHSSWPYFAHRFGLRVVNFVEPKPGVPASPAHIEALIRQMREEKVRLLIMEPFFSDRVPRLVAKETGAQLLILPPSVGGVKGVNTYIELLEYDVRRIVEALR
ncbi:MAG: zinc ABC transporter substrate-binding protein [Deltaproteobacteria bacterium]|nr:zinc ABC transporter substrate-binding protein [Deltaproteobacteria bacterium]